MLLNQSIAIHSPFPYPPVFHLNELACFLAYQTDRVLGIVYSNRACFSIKRFIVHSTGRYRCGSTSSLSIGNWFRLLCSLFLIKRYVVHSFYSFPLRFFILILTFTLWIRSTLNSRKNSLSIIFNNSVRFLEINWMHPVDGTSRFSMKLLNRNFIKICFSRYQKRTWHSLSKGAQVRDWLRITRASELNPDPFPPTPRYHSYSYTTCEAESFLIENNSERSHNRGDTGATFFFSTKIIRQSLTKSWFYINWAFRRIIFFVTFSLIFRLMQYTLSKSFVAY